LQRAEKVEKYLLTKPNLVQGGVKFVPFLSSGCIKLRRLKSIDQTRPGAGWCEVCAFPSFRL
jgi:hypothetical protein